MHHYGSKKKAKERVVREGRKEDMKPKGSRSKEDEVWSTRDEGERSRGGMRVG
jgi:hypothetical protein